MRRRQSRPAWKRSGAHSSKYCRILHKPFPRQLITRAAKDARRYIQKGKHPTRIRRTPITKLYPIPTNYEHKQQTHHNSTPQKKTVRTNTGRNRPATSNSYDTEAAKIIRHRLQQSDRDNNLALNDQSNNRVQITNTSNNEDQTCGGDNLAQHGKEAGRTPPNTVGSSTNRSPDN